MTSFEWFASLAPEGQFMCCLCFEAHPVEQAYRDDEGTAWDLCADCAAEEGL